MQPGFGRRRAWRGSALASSSGQFAAGAEGSRRLLFAWQGVCVARLLRRRELRCTRARGRSAGRVAVGGAVSDVEERAEVRGGPTALKQCVVPGVLCRSPSMSRPYECRSSPRTSSSRAVASPSAVVSGDQPVVDWNDLLDHRQCLAPGSTDGNFVAAKSSVTRSARSPRPPLRTAAPSGSAARRRRSRRSGHLREHRLECRRVEGFESRLRVGYVRELGDQCGSDCMAEQHDDLVGLAAVLDGSRTATGFTSTASACRTADRRTAIGGVASPGRSGDTGRRIGAASVPSWARLARDPHPCRPPRAGPPPTYAARAQDRR